jgi:hypothetical protein
MLKHDLPERIDEAAELDSGSAAGLYAKAVPNLSGPQFPH